MDVTLYPTALLPHKWTLENYNQILFKTTYAPVFRWLFNSAFVAAVHMIIQLIICSMAAYSFSRFKYKGRELIFWILMSTMMVPPIVNFIPLYKIMADFKWIDTYMALIVPGFGSAFDIFLIRQFMIGIPRELEESVYIDGGNSWQIFAKLIIPLSKPALFVVGLFSFMGNWNDLLWPLVATNKITMRTITAGLSIAQGSFEHEYTLINTITVLSAIPLVIIFAFAQKYFMHGLALSSGLKE
jgi:multiple sugar transport system permease protein